MDSGTLSAQLEKLPASGLTLKLHSSPLLIKAYLIFFLLLLTAVFLLAIPLWQWLLIMVALTGYFQYLFRKDILLNHDRSAATLVLTELDWCYIQLKNGQVIKADIRANTVLTEFVVILNLQASSASSSPFLGFFRTYSVILTADSIGTHYFRQLKRYLRFINLNKPVDEVQEESIIRSE